MRAPCTAAAAPAPASGLKGTELLRCPLAPRALCCSVRHRAMQRHALQCYAMPHVRRRQRAGQARAQAVAGRQPGAAGRAARQGPAHSGHDWCVARGSLHCPGPACAAATATTATAAVAVRLHGALTSMRGGGCSCGPLRVAGKGMAKKQGVRAARKLEEAFETGMAQRKGMGKKKREERGGCCFAVHTGMWERTGLGSKALLFTSAWQARLCRVCLVPAVVPCATPVHALPLPPLPCACLQQRTGTGGCRSWGRDSRAGLCA